MILKFMYALLALVVSSFLFDLYNSRTLLLMVDAMFIFAIFCLIWGTKELMRIDAHIRESNKHHHD